MVVISRSPPRGSTSMSAMSWSRSDGVSVRSLSAGSVVSGHGALDRLRHQHVADRVLAILDVEATQVIVDARAQLEAVERRPRLAVEAQPMQTQPPALHEPARHLVVERLHARAGERARDA